jgi:HD-GYP domain-containing protein (c-di-GMP phosphodiesterase class II)
VNTPECIISERVAGSLSVPKGLESVCLFSPDPLDTVFRLLQKREQSLRAGISEPPLKLLFFTESESVASLNESLKGTGAERLRYLIAAFSSSSSCCDEPGAIPHLVSYRSSMMEPGEFSFLLERSRFLLADEEKSSEEQTRYQATLVDTWRDQESLIRIGKSLSLERDPDMLLRTILYLSKKITGADAGSIFLVEQGDSGPQLRFKQSHTFSRNINYSEFTMPLNKNSIAGYVAVTGEVLNIKDVYHLPENSLFKFNRAFDQENGYRTKSMLVVPMRGTLDRIIGVIQLINSKECFDSSSDGEEAFRVLLESDEDFSKLVNPFQERYKGLMEAVAGQAAIALENNRMLKQIEQQFHSFVKASVKAIESRDPPTSGHSFRVSAMCVACARAVNRDRMLFPETHFQESQLRELEFAALLHDFGKVYIEPGLFLKGKKLFDKDFSYLRLRLHFLYRSIEASASEPESREDKLQRLREIFETVTRLNEPSVIESDPTEEIERIRSLMDYFFCTDPEGTIVPLLTDQEAENLSIRRGSLNREERKIIESHVERTWDFVRMIPWPEEYRNIPEIARDHHEMLDGSGYPRGKTAEEIGLEARIMAIADIFDALSAADRPYKKALPLDRVLTIIKSEADAGKLDKNLVQLWIEQEVWREDKWDSLPW